MKRHVYEQQKVGMMLFNNKLGREEAKINKLEYKGILGQVESEGNDNHDEGRILDKKVIIPKFLAGYITEAKRDGLTLQKALLPSDRRETYGMYVADWTDEEVYNFSNAWVNGYELEEGK